MKQKPHEIIDPGEKGLTINKNNFLFIVAILIAGIIAYSNSFDCSLHFDDANVFDSSVTVNSADIGDWLRLLPSRPLGILTFAINYKIHGLDVWGYHLVNLIIHLINAFFVWWLTWLTLSTPVMKDEAISRHKAMIAFLTGLLFVTHPLATQSVTYIAQRFASLATLFYLLSLILFVQGKLRQGNKNIPWFLFGGSIVCATLGMLTKEIVFTLPFAIIMYDHFFLQTDSRELKTKDKSLLISFIMLVIFIFLFFRNYSLNIFETVPPGQGYSYSISMKEYFLTQFSVILTYIRLFFLPINQNLDYDYQMSTGFFQLRTILSFSVLLGILASGVLLFKKYRLISFGIFWFFLTLSVESSIIPIAQDVLFEHRTYLPSFGFFLALTCAFFYFSKEIKVAVIMLLTVVSINTVLTHQRNKIWKSEYTLWSDCVKKSPNKARANNNCGVSLFNEGKVEEAIGYYNKAIRLTPYYDVSYNNRGNAYAKFGQYQRAIEDYNQAIRLKSDYAEAYSNRGCAYAELEQRKQAIKDFNEAIRLKPDFAEAYYGKGNVYAKLNQQMQAIEEYSKAIRIKPHYTEFYIKRGNVYANLGQYNLAIDDFSKSIGLKHNYAIAYNNRGITYAKTGRYQLAIEDFEEAIRLQPDYAEAYYNRGNAYGELGQDQRAIEDYNKAIRLKPDYVRAYNNRGNNYLKQGNKLGCYDAQKACELGNCKTIEAAKGRGFCR